MTNKKEGYYYLFKKTRIENMQISERLPESDYAVFQKGHLYQFKYVEPVKKVNKRKKK